VIKVFLQTLRDLVRREVDPLALALVPAAAVVLVVLGPATAWPLVCACVCTLLAIVVGVMPDACVAIYFQISGYERNISPLRNL
jgi:hypothetical protein